MKLGFLTDLHLMDAVPGTSPIEKRRCREMREVLWRNFSRLNEKGAELIICAGDLVDDPDHPDAVKDLALLKHMFEACGKPAIIIPGNHDPHPEEFYKIFKPPDRVARIDDIEIITFYEDFCRPGEEDSERQDLGMMEKLLEKNPAGVENTLIIQHYIVYPEISTDYPYNYRNSKEIRRIMEESPRRIFSLSGHYHRGFDVIDHKGVGYFCGKAMCEVPFPCYIIELSDKEITVREI